MLRSGFEPESSARKAEMIGRYTIGALKRFPVVPGGFEPPSPAPKAGRIDHYPTGLLFFTSIHHHTYYLWQKVQTGAASF